MIQSIEHTHAGEYPTTSSRAGLRGNLQPASSAEIVARAGAVFLFALLCQLLVAAAPFVARAACTPDPPTADGDTITCTGIDSTGYDGSSFDDLTVNVEPTAELDDSDPLLDAAILLEKGNTVDVRGNTIITVTEDGGHGIRGGDHNDITLKGILRVDADDARGVSIGSRTDPNNGLGEISVDSPFAIVEVSGNRSAGLEAAYDVNVSNAGTIGVDGNNSQAITVLDRTIFTFMSTVENSGAIDVSGDGSVGIRAGDGWYLNDINASDPERAPTGSGINLLSGSTLDIRGSGAYGLYLGDNSFATTSGSVDVSGANAIGVSLGGNDLLDDPDESLEIVRNLLESSSISNGTVFSLIHWDSIAGGPDAGPLVELRDSSKTGENRIVIASSALLTADLTNQGTANRAIAIRGSDASDLVINFGEIQGDVLLQGGDDHFVQGSLAVFDGVLDGGTGDDELVLAASSGGAGSFDVSTLANFETLRIGGGDGWSLTNAAGFTGMTRVEPGGRFVVSAPTMLGGDLSIDSTATVEVDLDGIAVPLSVSGTASLDGTLIVNPDANLAPSATPYRVVLAGTRNGVFNQIDVIGASGTKLYTPEYDALGLTLLYELLPVSSLARGRNNQAILDHLIEIDDSGGGSGDVQSFIDELGNLTVAEANSAFSAFSPEAYDAQTSLVVEGGRRVAHLLLDRPRECIPGKLDPWIDAAAPLRCHERSWSPWLAGVGGFRSRDKFAGHPRYDSSIGGLVVGIDSSPMENLDLTFAIGSQHGTVNVAAAEKSTLTLTDISGHAAYTHGPVRAQTVLSWGHGFHDDKRQMKFISDGASGVTSVRANTDHDSDRVTLAAELGYELDVGPVMVEPLLGLDWAWVWQRSFTEDDAGGFGLQVDDRSDSVGSINMGVRASTTYHHTRYISPELMWLEGIWQPEIDLRWRQMLEGTDRDVDARFEGAPGSVSDFTIEGKEDDGGFEIGLGVSFIPSQANRLQFGLRYETYIASHTLDQTLTARVLVAF
jgi:uncharacterized protein with beta-barrel porin domain